SRGRDRAWRADSPSAAPASHCARPSATGDPAVRRRRAFRLQTRKRPGSLLPGRLVQAPDALVEETGDDGGDQAGGDGGHDHVVAAAHILVAAGRLAQAVAAVVADDIAVRAVVGRHPLAIGPGPGLIAARRLVAPGVVAALRLLPAGVGALVLPRLAAVATTVLTPCATVLAGVAAVIATVVAAIVALFVAVAARLRFGGGGGAQGGRREGGGEGGGESLVHGRSPGAAEGFRLARTLDPGP